MKFFSKIYSIISSLIAKLFGLLELFLFLRLLLKFLNANPKTFIVDLIYSSSDFLVSPFYLIFKNIYWKGFTLDTATVSAMVGYAILALVVFKILRLLEKG